MCRQCSSGNHHQCLGVVYSYALQEFRNCQCAFMTEDGELEHAAV